ncbi:glycosyltransferase [Ammonifex thiophilus]|uniref:Glycosyltransferase n=1 Tax=Ammonifex thiophilus TaxID=444093 RepID=A0A3D8P4F7_9THEO|nr:glycosyltransferase [Ammonifex thiophilus]RDV84032.1 glycosyltransferase [Ammonifex thiophilus]
MDTARFMTLNLAGFARKLFLNPPLSGRQALAMRQGLHLSWRFYREGEVWIGIPPLGVLPLSGPAGRAKLQYSLLTLAFPLKRLLGPQWRKQTLFYIPSGALLLGAELVRRLKPSYFILDVLDDNLNFPRVKEKHRLKETFIYLVGRATLVTAVSEPLVEHLRVEFGIKAHYLPNGVEVERFAPCPAYEEPWPELASLERPILGFVGTLTDWIDYRLLLDLANSLSHGQVLLAGPVVEDTVPADLWEALKRHPRVVFLGPQPYEKVPHLLHQLDLLLLPRNYLPHSLACDPLKLYEYLATGKPVVATDLPAVRRFAGLVYVARGREEFIKLVDKALREWTPEKADRARRAAESFSWRRRADRMINLLKEVAPGVHPA